MSGSDDGLIALNAKTGKEIWRYTKAQEEIWRFTSLGIPFLYKDMIYVDYEGDIIALSAESGEEVWKTNISEWASVAGVKNDKLFISSYGPLILDANTGEILKELPDSRVFASSRVITDNYIYSTDKYYIKVFNSSTGELVWGSSRIKGVVISDPVLYEDKLYLISSEGVLYAFEHGKEGLFFTRGLEGAAILYFPLFAVAGMIFLLTKLVRKYENTTLVFGSWLIALVGVLLLSFIAIEPYIRTWDVLGILPFLVFCFLAVILLFGIAFFLWNSEEKDRKINEKDSCFWI